MRDRLVWEGVVDLLKECLKHAMDVNTVKITVNLYKGFLNKINPKGFLITLYKGLIYIM